MNRTTAVTIWREVCGSDTVMSMLPPTGRMLEDFTRRISEMERDACAAIVESTANIAHEGPPEKAQQAFMLDNCAIAIRMRPNKQVQRPAESGSDATYG